MRAHFLLAAALTFAAPAFAQQPTEAQCKAMVDGLIQAMKKATIPERDKKGAQEVIDRAEKIARENRARGAPECDSYAAIGKIVTGQ